MYHCLGVSFVLFSQEQNLLRITKKFSDIKLENKIIQ